MRVDFLLGYRWSEKEEEILRTLWGKVEIEEIAKVLKGRSNAGIVKKAHVLKLGPIQVEIDLEYYAELIKVTEG